MRFVIHILTFHISFKNFRLLFISIICLALLAPFQVFAKQSTFKSFKTTSSFIENKGQIIDQNNKPNPAILYLLNTPGFNVQVRNGGFSYDIYSIENSKVNDQMSKLQPKDLKSLVVDRSPRTIHFHRIDFDLQNINSGFNIETSESSTDYLNYYTSGTPGNGITSVHSYKCITYKNIYQGIDLEFMMNDQQGFKYTFVVHPGGSINSIQIKIKGSDNNLDKAGSLELKTAFGTITEEVPLSYIQSNTSRTDVKTRFRQLDKDIYGFSMESGEEENSTLVIDPMPFRMWATYYGGENSDDLSEGTIDTSGNLILSGSTSSVVNIATSGTFQNDYAGNDDGFIVKFTSGGQRVWGTYYGGSQYDAFLDCKVDAHGDIYALGQTLSDSNISSSGAYKTNKGGGYDVFLVKFTPNGQRIWGTYYGGGADEYAGNCALENDSCVYICGTTASDDSISTPGSYQPSRGGLEDAFIVKFDSAGGLIWGTYYGGNNYDLGYSISLDTIHHLILAGQTQSTNNMASTGAFQPSFGGMIDAFLAEFDLNGQRIWGTYYGGEEIDLGLYCSTTKSGETYLIGPTNSTTQISTPGSYQAVLAGMMDAFLVKFNADGERVWGTYFGGSNDDRGEKVAIDDSGFVFIAGWTASLVGIATTDSYQTTYSGNEDAFLAKFSPSGLRIWGTYYGGPDVEDAKGIVVSNEHQYLAGATNSLINISTPGSFQQDYGGGDWDGFLVKFGDCILPDSAVIITGPESICQNTSGEVYSTPVISNATIYHWSFPAGIIPVNGQNTNTITVDFTSGASSGYISVYGVSSCGSGDSASVFVSVLPRPLPVITGPDTSCQGQIKFYSTSSGKSFYQWNFSAGGTLFSGGGSSDDQLGILWTTIGNQWVRVNYIDTNWCTGIVPTQYNVFVGISDSVKVTISASNSALCSGTTLTFTAIPTNGGSAPFYQWKVNGVIVGTNNPIYSYTPVNGDIVTCILTSNILCPTGNPATSNTITMTVNPNLPVSVSISSSSNPFCQGTSVTFIASPTNGGAAPSYQWKVNGGNAGLNNPVYSYSPNSGDIVTCVLTSNVVCPTGNPATSNSITMIVNVNLPAGISITASTNPFCPGNSVTFTATPVNGGPTPAYQWKVNGVNAGSNSSIFTYNPISGDLVSCILTSNLVCVTGNPANSNTILMSGTLAPIVTFTICNDTITTTNAIPFKLKGGIPLGGIYSGAGVAGGIFNPAIAGIGNHQINYTYTNAALCSTTAHSFLHTFNPSNLPCGSPLTDIRDNKIYQTVKIGSQCWMAENLDYGYTIGESTNQRDNCIPEKYHNPASSIQNPASVYQWDEIMNYDETTSNQGLCPPGWHVPTEADWNSLFANYISNGFAGSPLKYSGFSGFSAILSGARHLNKTWDYQGFATFFWSSTMQGSNKAWSHGMNDIDPSVSFYPAFRTNAFSVRCLHD